MAGRELAHAGNHAVGLRHIVELQVLVQHGGIQLPGDVPGQQRFHFRGKGTKIFRRVVEQGLFAKTVPAQQQRMFFGIVQGKSKEAAQLGQAGGALLHKQVEKHFGIGM